MEIGSIIRNARNNAKLSQEQAAEALGVSRQTISNWETGKSYPDIISVIRMSELYSVSLDHLLKEEDSMKQTYKEYLEESTNTWKLIDQIYLSSNGGMPNYDGSYNFGINDGKIYMITSGVGGDWFGNGKGKQGDFYTIK